MDDASIGRPTRRNEQRERTLPDGTTVKWCSECGAWGDHFRAGHPAEGIGAAVEIPRENAFVASVGMIAEATTDEFINGEFARLCLAGSEEGVCSHKYQPQQV